MKRGAHLLAPGPAGVEGRFVREIMLLLDRISGGGDKTQERERVHPCNVCNKAFKSLQMPSEHKIWQHSGHVYACKGCGKKFNPNNSINNLLCWTVKLINWFLFFLRCYSGFLKQTHHK